MEKTSHVLHLKVKTQSHKYLAIFLRCTLWGAFTHRKVHASLYNFPVLNWAQPGSPSENPSVNKSFFIFSQKNFSFFPLISMKSYQNSAGGVLRCFSCLKFTGPIIRNQQRFKSIFYVSCWFNFFKILILPFDGIEELTMVQWRCWRYCYIHRVALLSQGLHLVDIIISQIWGLWVAHYLACDIVGSEDMPSVGRKKNID